MVDWSVEIAAAHKVQIAKISPKKISKLLSES